MPNAYEQRQGWHEDLTNGKLPKDILRFIIMQKKRSDDQFHRSTGYVEALGEVAIVWYEQNYGKIPKEYIDE